MDNQPTQVHRCFWADGSEIYDNYHDTEWGYPVTDDIRLFEKISLEGFQAGLSWLTILKKREGFRRAFLGFDFERVAQMSTDDVERLVLNAEIVRHRGKILAVIHNAQRAIELRAEFGSLSRYFWQYEVDVSARPAVYDAAYLRQIGVPPEAQRLSKDLKKRGWKFVGPTTMYAFMQAMGLVNDHEHACHVRRACELARAAVQFK